jgi:uncharacterized membrane protein YecN with MAPEG domain
VRRARAVGAVITLLYASILALLLLVLTLRVVYLRRTLLVALGAGEHRRLEKAIRAHANLVEYVPLALILMALLEQQGAPPWQLHALGATLVVSRHLHAWGLSLHAGPSVGRIVGTTGTLLVLLAAGVLGLSRMVS